MWFDSLTKDDPPDDETNALVFQLVYRPKEDSLSQSECVVCVNGYSGYDPETKKFASISYTPHSMDRIWVSSVISDSYDAMQKRRKEDEDLEGYVMGIFLYFYLKLLVFHVLRRMKEEGHLNVLEGKYICSLMSSDHEVEADFKIEQGEIKKCRYWRKGYRAAMERLKEEEEAKSRRKGRGKKAGRSGTPKRTK
jgi:hypothetical protein